MRSRQVFDVIGGSGMEHATMVEGIELSFFDSVVSAL